LLRGLAELLAKETQLPVRLADSPLTCVAIGAGQSLEEGPLVQRVADTARRRTRLPSL
jgi:rod shape-determining protein MreB